MNIRYFVGTLALLSIVGALFSIAGQASAATLTVDDDWSGANNSTIQDAINVSETGDTIRVHAGTYNEDIVVNQTVLIVGNGSAETIINGTGDDNAVHVASADAGIRNVTIQGAAFNKYDVYAEYSGLNMSNCSFLGYTRGIYMNHAHYSTLTDCHFEGQITGARAYFTISPTFLRCNFTNMTEFGVELYRDGSVAFLNTTFNGCSVRIDGNIDQHHDSHTFDNSTVNGKPILYHADEDNFTVDSEAGEVILGNCRDVIVENIEIQNGSVGINIGMSTRVTVRNCVIADQYNGVYVTYSDNCTLEDLRVYDTSQDGLRFTYCDDCLIDGLNATGMDIGDGLEIDQYSQHVRVNGSRIFDFYYGVANRGKNSTFENTTLENCYYGAHVSGEGGTTFRNCDIFDNRYGIMFSVCDWNLVENSSIHENLNHAVRVWNSDNNTIRFNEMFSNTNQAIYVDGSSWGNSIHHNNIANNGGGSAQASDNTGEGDNTWDDGVSDGNYWDDWGGNGTYVIGGIANAEDRYPLEDPVDTDAPEKIPALASLLVMMTLVVLIFAVRRRL